MCPSLKILLKVLFRVFYGGIKFEADKNDCVISSGHSYQSKKGVTLTLNGEIKSNVSKILPSGGPYLFI